MATVAPRPKPDTRASAPSRSRRRGGQRLRRDAKVAIEIVLQRLGLAEKDVVRVELIALAAEAADRLQSVDELGLGLRHHTRQFLVGRTFRGKPRDLFGDGSLRPRPSVRPGAAVATLS